MFVIESGGHLAHVLAQGIVIGLGAKSISTSSADSHVTEQ